MKSRMVIVFLLSTTLSGWAQKVEQYYLSGRPYTPQYFNALMIAAAQWNIRFVYMSDAEVMAIGWEEFDRMNKVSHDRIALKTKLGDDWLSKVHEMATLEEQRHNLFRSWIESDEEYKNLSEMLFEPLVLFTKEKKNKSTIYKAYVVGQMKDDETRKFSTHAVYSVDLKKASIVRLRKVNGALPFTLPQNGIE